MPGASLFAPDRQLVVADVRDERRALAEIGRERRDIVVDPQPGRRIGPRLRRDDDEAGPVLLVRAPATKVLRAIRPVPPSGRSIM